ncbi:MAG TPA: hypothetical protein VFL17_11850, partial [Anaerolineae bacterium]|nr:hypothetical protein [Anaerolineae bacterium]
YEITDRAAVEFAHAFYEALSDGLPVDAAVSEARKAVSLAVPNTVEWGTPVLYMRAPQGVIFQVPESRRGPRPAAPRPVEMDKGLQQRLEQLYTDGLSAFWVEDWDKACRSFQAILDARPDYPGAAAKLDEAQRHRKLSELYGAARTAQEAGDWPAAQSALESLVAQAADYKDAAAQLRSVKKQKRLADLYAEARRLRQARQWQATVNIFAQITALDPNYADPDELLSTAEREVAALKRQAELNDLYGRAVRAIDAGDWPAAHQLLEKLQATEPGFRDTERLLSKAQAEMAREEKERQRQEQIATLHEQALGLARARQWRQVLAKMEEIRSLDEEFADPEGIAAKAQAEVTKEEEEAQQQNESAALYAEAVRLLRAGQYQEALEKWGEVQAINPGYVDRHQVQATAKKKLNELAKASAPKPRVPEWVVIIVCVLGLLAIIAVALSSRGGDGPCATLDECLGQAEELRAGGDLQGAMERYSRALDFVPGDQRAPNAWIWCDMGELNRRLKRFDDAVSDFERCIQWIEGYPDPQGLRAWAERALRELQPR